MALVSTTASSGLQIISPVFGSTQAQNTAVLTIPQGQIFEGFIYPSSGQTSVQAKIGSRIVDFPMYASSGSMRSYPLYIKGEVGGTTISTTTSQYFITVTGYLKG